MTMVPILADPDPALIARATAILAEPMAGKRMTREHIDVLTTIMGVTAARMYATLKARSDNARRVLTVYVNGRREVRLP